jgi:hypothetical protein
VTLHELADLALSHHHQDQLERCIVVQGHGVCRRCSVLYPIAFGVMGLALASTALPAAVAVAFMLTLPVPASVEFLGEQFGRFPYDARRQVAVTALAAPALGLGFARVLNQRTDPWFWLMVAVFAVPCTMVSILRARGTQQVHRAARVALDECRPLLREFETAEEFQAYLDAVEVTETRSPNREREMLTDMSVTGQELTRSSRRVSDDEAVERVSCP